MAGKDLASGGRRSRRWSVIRTTSPAARETIISERLKEDPTLDPATGLPPKAAKSKGKAAPGGDDEADFAEDQFPIPKFKPDEIVELKRYTGLARLPEETDEQYRCFLLYAMQDPERRSKRAVWRAIGRSGAESKILTWWKKNRWEDRILTDGSDSAAAVVYGKLYYRRFSVGEVRHLADLLKQPFKAPVIKNEVPSKLDGLLEAEAKQAQAQSAHRAKLAGAIGDSVLNKIGKAVSDPEYQPKLSDINHVELLYKVSSQHKTSVTASPGNESRSDLPHLSERVQQAKRTGNPAAILDAILEDSRELALIMEVITAQADADEKSGLSEVFKGTLTFVPPSKTGDTSSEIKSEVAEA